jgi:NAD(P)-dependent dehydrogenase (short-subunit alcohol dehydrogenase family)
MSKIVLVTGTSTGLGTSISVQAAQKRHKVYATMRDLSKAADLEKAAQTAGVSLEILQLDVQDADSVNAAIATAIEREGRIDVLVNNAGAGFARSTEQAPLEDIAWVMDVNFMGVVRATKAVLPHMRRARSGHVINISSVGGLVGQPFNEVYCAAKFAVEGYTEALAAYIQPGFGIKFTAIEPGGIHSEFANSAMKQIASTGGMLEDEYLPLIQQYLAAARARGATAYQTSDEVAAVIMECIDSAEPPIRVRTSAWAKDLCDLKTSADPDGKKMQKKVVEMFLGN